MINACISCSSEEQEQGKGSWEMSLGLDTTRVQFQGWDWDRYNSTTAMLFPRHCHHQQQHSDSEEQKPLIMTPTSYREYNGMGFSQSAVGVLHSSGIRSLGGPNDGIPSSSFHPNLLYSGMYGGFGSNYGGENGSHHSEQQRQLIGLMNGMDQQYEKGSALVKREDGDFQARIGLNLGHRTYFSSEDMTAVSRLYKRPRAIPPGSVQIPRCQAEGCKADLSNAKHYHRRHKVCELHSKATSVVTAGLQQRFCQQCSRFHVLAEFDEVKRSCRKRLADHNRRRRKPQPNVAASSSCTTAETTALKVEDEHNNNGSGGLQAAPILRTEAQALLNAISISSSQLPSMIRSSSKAQIPPAVLQAKSPKLVPCQQYTQSGPNLSLSSVGGAMGLCNQRQAATHDDYSGLELALPWLRPCNNSEFNGSTPRPPMDILQPIISDKNDGQIVEAHAHFNSSSCIQNFLSLTGASSRELTSSQWMVGSNDDPQQMLSLLETPALRTAQDSGQQSQSRSVEYLSHQQQQQQGGMNSNESADGQSDAKFSEMQSLRVTFGQSMYEGDL